MPTAVVILVPPAAPITNLTSPFLSVRIVGAIDDNALLCGLMKLGGEPGSPK